VIRTTCRISAGSSTAPTPSATVVPRFYRRYLCARRLAQSAADTIPVDRVKFRQAGGEQEWLLSILKLHQRVPTASGVDLPFGDSHRFDEAASAPNTLSRGPNLVQNGPELLQNVAGSRMLLQFANCVFS